MLYTNLKLLKIEQLQKLSFWFDNYSFNNLIEKRKKLENLAVNCNFGEENLSLYSCTKTFVL